METPEYLNTRTPEYPPPLAQGATADIYPYPTGLVLKLFHAGCSRARVEEEAQTSRAVFEGLQRVREIDGRVAPRVPSVGEVVEMEGRYGIVFERIDRLSMLQLLLAQPEATAPLARQLAELQASLHTIGPSALPSNDPLARLPRQRERLRHRIQEVALSTPIRDALLQELESLYDQDDPLGLRLCHGDFHPGNVLMPSDDGSLENAVLIDWCDATLGSPYADVARSLVLFQACESVIPDPAFVARIPLFRDTYLAQYLELISGDTERIGAQIRRWLPVVAACRLTENIAPLEQARLERQVKGLSEH